MSESCSHGHDHRKAGRWGLFGGALSLLCALHCLALPILLPFASAFAHSLWLEVALVVGAAAIGAQALRHGFARHGFRLPAALFAIGMAMIVAGNWLVGGHDHDHKPALSLVLLGIGGAVIVVAHVWNYVLERKWLRRSNA